MTKWMRKRSKLLMGLGGSLLMVTFLLTGPQSIFNPDATKQVVGTINGQPLRRKELTQAEKELDALKDEAYPVRVLVSTLNIEKPEHWILLSREAQAAGMVGSEGDGSGWLPDLAKGLSPIFARSEVARKYPGFGEQLVRMGYLDNEINQMAGQLIEPLTKTLEDGRPKVASRHGLSLPDFDIALSKLRGILRLEQEYNTAARQSSVRAVSLIKKRVDSVQVDDIVIPADKALAGIPEPTDAQTSEQFVKYKETKPGSGEFGFGYLQPQRVKLEWMVLDRDAIGATVQLDPVSVFKFWQQHRETFKGEFPAEKANVEKAVRANAVDQILSDADRYYKASVKGTVRNLPQDGGFKKLPADWDQTRPTMATLAKAVTENLKAGSKVDIPLPTVGSKTDAWEKIDRSRELPGVGTAGADIGTKHVTLPDLLGSLHELNPKGDLGLQVKVPFETGLKDGKGNMYYINVLDFRAESAPETLDEVKADVVKDIKLKAAYDKLKAEKDTYQVLAVQDGLEAVGKLFATPAPAAAPGQPTPEPTPLPVQKFQTVQREHGAGILDAKEARDTIMAFADALGPQMAATPGNVAERTLSVAIPGQLSIAIVQILGQTPLTQETLEHVSKSYLDSLASGELLDAVGSEASPFTFAAMKERFAYKAVSSDESKGKSAPVRSGDLP